MQPDTFFKIFTILQNVQNFFNCQNYNCSFITFLKY